MYSHHSFVLRIPSYTALVSSGFFLLISVVPLVAGHAGQPVSLETPTAVALYGEKEKKPIPKLGIEFGYGSVIQDGKLTGLTVDAGAAVADGIAESVVSIEGRVQRYGVHLDYLVLPFLDVFVGGAYLEGNTATTLRDSPEPFDFTYSGYEAIAGATLFAGSEDLWISLTGVATKTWWDNNDDTTELLVLAPRVGTKWKETLFWAGVNLWWLEETRSGTLALPGGGETGFVSTLEQQDTLNFAVGLQTEIVDHWALKVEVGFSQRRQVTIAIQKRF